MSPHSVLVSLVLLSLAFGGGHAVRSEQKPHIFMLLVDDLGWANVGYHRETPTKEVVTPNLDGLAHSGVKLERHYVYQFCSPTRSSFLSGRLPIHVNDRNDDATISNPDDPVSGFAGIPRNMTVIAQKLKEANYSTHQVGKWNAGMATPTHTPVGRGFDSGLCYFQAQNDYFTEKYEGNFCLVPKDGEEGSNSSRVQQMYDLWDSDRPAVDLVETDYEEFIFRDRVLKIIEEYDPESENPLFILYTPHLVHGPLQVPQEYLDKFSFIDDEARQKYHAMVNCLDDIVGNITQSLKAKGLWDNLLFVMSSDNGGPLYANGGANNYPLKGGKVSDWEGGVRVNAFASGGFIPKRMRGQSLNEPMHIADWYATFSHLAGVDPEDKAAEAANLPPIDSLNMWDVISGANSTSPRVDIPISYNTLISGQYKLLTGEVLFSSWTGPTYPNTTGPVPPAGGMILPGKNCRNGGCLYDIIADPTEHNELVDRDDIKADLMDKLKDYQAGYFNPDRGFINIRACIHAVGEYHNFWGPFLN